jgi:secreted trypsin-like serine protease
MVYIYLLFLVNISFVLSITYSCDRNAACGCSKIDATLNKIVGGEAAVNSSWGWAVSLRKDFSGHFCGGVIISPLHIITAAHCVVNSSDIIQNARVVVGINVLSEATSSIAQVRSVISVFSHPQYSSVSKANDIAVLRLNQALNISNGVGTARLCLPYVMTTNTTNNYPVPGSSLVAIGWGTIISSEQFIPSSRHLQQVTVNGISASHSMCKGTINDRQLQFCAGVIGGGKGKKLRIRFLF